MGMSSEQLSADRMVFPTVRLNGTTCALPLTNPDTTTSKGIGTFLAGVGRAKANINCVTPTL